MSRRSEAVGSSSQRSSSRLANSSSSNVTEQRTGRKRPVEEIDIEEENETPNNEVTNDDVLVNPAVARKYDVNSFLFQPNEKDLQKFDSLSHDVQAQCVKAVSRLFIMKGARKESISRDAIRSVLNEIDSEYKKHVAVVLKRVQQLLCKSLGYVIVSSDSILGMKKTGKSDEYYVTNNLSSPKLMKLLNQAKRYNHYHIAGTHRNLGSSASSSSLTQNGRSSRRDSSSRLNYNEDARGENDDNDEEEAAVDVSIGSGGTTIAYIGFLVVVCGTIYTAPQKKITCEDLLAHIRKVDPRFPSRLTKEGSTVCPVPELEEQFLSLIKRLQKEHYLVGKKPEGDKGEENVIYSLGPRFYLDIGRKELMIKYFQLMDQPMDEFILREIEEDAKKEIGQTEENEEPPAAGNASSSSSNANTGAASVAAPASSSSSSNSRRAK